MGTNWSLRQRGSKAAQKQTCMKKERFLALIKNDASMINKSMVSMTYTIQEFSGIFRIFIGKSTTIKNCFNIEGNIGCVFYELIALQNGHYIIPIQYKEQHIQMDRPKNQGVAKTKTLPGSILQFVLQLALPFTMHQLVVS